MSLEAMAWAVNHKLPEGNEKLLLVILGNFAGPHGICYPGHETLARMCPCSVRTVGRRMQDLEALDLIARAPRFRVNGSRTSDWIVLGPHEYRGGPGQMIEPTADDAPPKVLALITPPFIPPSAKMAGGDQMPTGARPSANGGGSRTVQEEPPSLLPSFGEMDRVAAAPQAVRYYGKRVPGTVVTAALDALTLFNELGGRKLAPWRSDGRPSQHLREIIGAMLAHEEATHTDWERALRNTFANPPGWAGDRVLQIGDVFGKKAADHALCNSGKPSTRAAGGNGTVSKGDALLAKLRAAKEEAEA